MKQFKKFQKLYRENQYVKFALIIILLPFFILAVRILFTIPGWCGEIERGEKSVVDSRILFVCDFPNNVLGNPNPYYK